MADTAQLNRITRFFGGITINDKDNANGVALNVEEVDIFSNTDFIKPNTIFEPDSVITRNCLSPRIVVCVWLKLRRHRNHYLHVPRP